MRTSDLLLNWPPRRAALPVHGTTAPLRPPRAWTVSYTDLDLETRAGRDALANRAVAAVDLLRAARDAASLRARSSPW